MTEQEQPKVKIGDQWRTPPEPFNTLHKEFHFIADMASTHKNAKLPLHFTEEQDSLSVDWSEVACLQGNRLEYVFVNPPYSNPLPWVMQAAKAQLGGLGVVMLLNADTSVGWFAEALKTVSEIRFIIGAQKKNGHYASGRIGFLNGEGKPISSNNKPQFILVFNPYKIGARVTSYVKKSELYGK